jgi:NAD(P)-dependent dehydrogenase (short-subunit alcohol dehydrogenase family)
MRRTDVRGLETKVVIVAGAASGIGKATALRIGEERAAVVVGDLDGDGAARVAAEIVAGGGRAVGVQYDASDDEAVTALVAAAVETFGGVDAVHANAADLSAGNLGRDTDASDLPDDVFERTLDVNLRGYMRCTRAALPHMLERGRGSFVYTSSAASFVGEPTRVAYALSKAGVNALARHVAGKWGRKGIRANAVAPGLVLTEATVDMPEEFKKVAMRGSRSPRLGNPSDIAAMVAFLCSDDAEWINGQVISVDGGVTLR